MEWLSWIIEKIKYRSFHKSCYGTMEKEGFASNECCFGVSGGNRGTDYTAEFCLNCPYYTPINRQEEKNGAVD